MILSWNVRGINNLGKCREVSSHLTNLHPILSIILETRVKASKAEKVRSKIGNKWSYIDNSTKHNNGRIWILFDEGKIQVRKEHCTDQLIHIGVYDTNG